ncbi:hypothetical protein RJ639_014954 [Escallonia herrerae]|uniref:PB1-like domain-containing protein n=1 Tax=Escallonia herrerae TaxID=1293975 RepID=A0AA88VJF9_9ASTE|nr:hypothetical protein RJ639_014954 [Escallonia herrerae]
MNSSCSEIRKLVVFDNVTLEFHYGGLFTSSPNRTYQGGIVASIENYDLDFISYWELIGLLEDDLRLPSSSLLYYVIPGVTFDHGLRSIIDDGGVADMVRYCSDSGVLPIYVEKVDPLQVVGVDGQVVLGNVLRIECGDNGDVDDGMAVGDGDITQAEAGVNVEATPMASDLETKAKEAFIDDHFELAVDLYSQAIAMSPNAELFADRAQANIKVNNFTEAVTDANRAIELDPSMAKAYLRKGIHMTYAQSPIPATAAAISSVVSGAGESSDFGVRRSRSQAEGPPDLVAPSRLRCVGAMILIWSETRSSLVPSSVVTACRLPELNHQRSPGHLV